MMPLIPFDKANHIIYGSMWAQIGFTIALLVGPSAYDALFVGLALALLAGVGKEVKDWYDNKRAGKAVHSVEWMDIVATAAGGLPMLLTILALHFKG